MKIYAVLAVDISADYPYHADIVSYHRSLESANKKADEINKNPLSNYQSKATVSEITVLD